MRYLIACQLTEPFFTDNYDYENNWNSDIEMVVFDLASKVYTTDGKTWNDIKLDHL